MVTRRIQGSPVKVTGVTPSDVEFESHLEEDFLTLVRFDHRVEYFERYRDEIVWYDQSGKRRAYTPDFFIQYKRAADGSCLKPEVIEVKPDFEDDDPRSVARLPRKEDPYENDKWKAATKECGKKGWRFLVKRESEIRTPYLANARFLMAALERGRDDSRLDAVMAALKPGMRVSMGDLIASLGKDADERLTYRPALYRLIATRRVEVDLTELLQDSSLVGLPS
jgi:hypothetical protein